MKNRNILAIGAHPDDIELGCGGSIRKHILSGDKVYYIVASLGEKSGDKDKRRAETMAAGSLMGVENIFFLNLPDTMIMHNGITVNLLDKYIEKIEPEIVYVHSHRDYHQDHANIAHSVLSASRHIRSSIFFYETPSTTIEFRPVAYNDISKVFECKLKCIEQYTSQSDKEYMEKEAIIGLAKVRGRTVGVEFAEAFEVARLFKW
ncbi:MAG: PIG-L family deacetylase [Candidatus Thorarchaeota archaeon]|nr:MAG: PIG-L family deacetylase [Candidatus Thorarchaeota archaeon]